MGLTGGFCDQAPCGEVATISTQVRRVFAKDSLTTIGAFPRQFKIEWQLLSGLLGSVGHRGLCGCGFAFDRFFPSLNLKKENVFYTAPRNPAREYLLWYLQF